MDVSALHPYGWGDHWSALLLDLGRAGARPARVVRHDGVAVTVAGAAGAEQVPFRRRLDPTPIVGDWVAIGDGVVEAVLPRRSVLRRRDAETGAEHPLVANVDASLIVCGADRPLRAGRIQRFAALAWDADAPPTIVVTKADLADADADALDALVAEARRADPAADVVVASAVTGVGLDAVRAAIGDGTAVLLGESGAGKSRLINALVGDEVALTGAVRAGDRKGRHTTTSRELHLLPGGGVLIDTPGVRAVGLSADPESVSDAFAEVDALAEHCRFRDCSHGGEPGFAVAAAVEAGTLAADRLAGWDRLRGEAEAAAERADGPPRRRR